MLIYNIKWLLFLLLFLPELLFYSIHVYVCMHARVCVCVSFSQQNFLLCQNNRRKRGWCCIQKGELDSLIGGCEMIRGEFGMGVQAGLREREGYLREPRPSSCNKQTQTFLRCMSNADQTASFQTIAWTQVHCIMWFHFWVPHFLLHQFHPFYWLKPGIWPQLNAKGAWKKFFYWLMY